MSFLTEYFGIYAETGEHAVCCPFPHKLPNGTEYYESRPSAHVNAEKNLFHCKVCEEGLNEIQFIMKILGCDFQEATKIQKCFATTEDVGEWIESTSLTPASKLKALSLGISESAIEELHIGTHPEMEDALSFPVTMFDHLCDVRTYNPGHTPKVKSRQNCPAGLIIPFDIWRLSDPKDGL